MEHREHHPFDESPADPVDAVGILDAGLEKNMRRLKPVFLRDDEAGLPLYHYDCYSGSLEQKVSLCDALGKPPSGCLCIVVYVSRLGLVGAVGSKPAVAVVGQYGLEMVT